GASFHQGLSKKQEVGIRAELEALGIWSFGYKPTLDHHP
ncbi:hypothetical protein A2U01_0076055, partial [Trifolium medium]|nr:hypothetical protein [Trifolium medium]